MREPFLWTIRAIEGPDSLIEIRLSRMNYRVTVTRGGRSSTRA